MSVHSPATGAPARPSGGAPAPAHLVILWSARGSGSPAELERWAREQLPVLRAAPGVHGVSLRRVAPASPHWMVDWDWAFELRLSAAAVGAVCGRGGCGDLLADMRLLGTRPVAMLLEGEPA